MRTCQNLSTTYGAEILTSRLLWLGSSRGWNHEGDHRRSRDRRSDSCGRSRSASTAHEVEIFERDASAAERRKGYAIGLKGDSGLAVLERLGLRDEVLAAGAQQVTNFVITDREGSRLLVLPSGNDGARHRYRVQRDHLQSVIATALAATRVRYGYQALGYETIATASSGFHWRSPCPGDVVMAATGWAPRCAASSSTTPHTSSGSPQLPVMPLCHEVPLLSGGYS